MKTNLVNASLLLERSKEIPNQYKGALALAIEKELGKSYAPMHWMYGPTGGGTKGDVAHHQSLPCGVGLRGDALREISQVAP